MPYLTSLSLATGYDALLVSDVATRGTGPKFNPYVPGALSDYRGAGRPILAHSEPGSMLSREQVDYRSRLGDARSVASVLSALSSQENP
ncbi:hypothetical protein [Tessaracoccus flavus]|uniref:hypothetical protein n=1 Tax=Tessaracoccus flavus TaxID=1610493 RepID=UPI00089760F4|nr:hypothetical protein [Tessaracoccus flavus]SDY85146.1 hypothetical protein SAMN05428934_10565 [Tessaracoccus flavus]